MCAVEIIHVPFVTPNAQRYLHLSNTPKFSLQPKSEKVTENPSQLFTHPVYRLGTKPWPCGLLNPKLVIFASVEFSDV